MKLRPLSAAVVLALSILSVPAHADNVRRPYIVQLADKPIASYDGQVTGLRATQPRSGSRIDLESADVKVYDTYLASKKSVVRAAVASAPILHEYKLVLNGFSAMLTDAEVRTLMARSDVVAVTADAPRELTTVSTRDFLGLDKPDGIWTKLGGKGAAGEDIIIGIVDGGVWPEHLSYADRVDSNGKPTFANNGTLAYDAPPPRWKGECATGEGFTVDHCNYKLIGAQYFDTTYKSTGNITHWTEFESSPRDSIGGTVGAGSHGTHVSTTAGGNSDVEATMNGVKVGEMSGVAPRARISSYKVCWSFLDDSAQGFRNGCYGGDSVAAIEKAVADGVHVINYSISGGTSINDPVEQAFFNAANAGVLGVASAGNDGPGNQVAHISPWHATVAASTHDREFQARVTLGNGRTFTGASLNAAALPSAPLIRAEDAGFANADPNRLRLCYSGQFDGAAAVLDPAKVAGKIVICTRGLNDRVDKSRAVLEAGGVGMIHVDTGTAILAEVHSVPTVHVNATDGAAIQAYAGANRNASASMTKFTIGTSATPAPMVADFSSRGPNRYDPNVLKPDISAPGVDIIAGGSPGMTEEQQADLINGTLVPDVAFVTLNGTSMAAPHVTGLAALLRQAHPTWTPAMIKSAMMTTATQTREDTLTGNQRGHMPFGQGAGHIDPTAALNPGLVYDIAPADYRKYMCGMGMTAQCGGGQIAGYELNLPSISVGNVLGNVTINRSVTNVSGADATYTGRIVVPGYEATVSPATLTIPKDQTRSFTVTLTRAGAPLNVWQFGQLTWTNGSQVVRSPVVARSGQPIIAPTYTESDRASGNRIMTVTTGFAGKMSAVTGGMKQIVPAGGTISSAPGSTLETAAQMAAACVNGAPYVRATPVTFTAETMAAHFQLFSRETSTPGRDDLDLVIVNSAGQLVASSTTTAANETISVAAPPPGNYRVCVLGYRTATGAPSTYALHSAIVTTADKGGNLRALVPAQVYAGGKATVPITWNGLPAGQRFLGAVRLLDNTGTVGSTTVLKIETNQPVPQSEDPTRSKLTDARF